MNKLFLHHFILRAAVHTSVLCTRSTKNLPRRKNLPRPFFKVAREKSGEEDKLEFWSWNRAWTPKPRRRMHSPEEGSDNGQLLFFFGFFLRLDPQREREVCPLWVRWERVGSRVQKTRGGSCGFCVAEKTTRRCQTRSSFAKAYFVEDRFHKICIR